MCYLFRNRDLMGPAAMHDAAKQIIRAPLNLGFAVEHAGISFAQALLRASRPPDQRFDGPHNDLANIVKSLYAGLGT